MIFRVTMKDPDGVSQSIQDAATDSVGALTTLDEQEREQLVEIRQEKLGEVCRKWFEYGEYLEVEVDTEAGTCTVIPRR